MPQKFDTHYKHLWTEQEHIAYNAYMREQYNLASSQSPYYEVSFDLSTYTLYDNLYEKRVSIKENGYHRVTTVTTKNLYTGAIETVSTKREMIEG